MIIERFCEFGILAIVLFLACCSGKAVLKQLKVYKLDSIQGLLFSSAIGLAGLSYITFLLGITALLYRPVLYGLLSGIFLLVLREIRETIIFLKARYAALANTNIGGINAAILIVILVSGILVLLGVTAPPSFYDALVYHVAAPDMYVKNHSIISVPYNFFTNFPAVGEMLFTAGLLLYNDILAKLIVFSIVVLNVAAIYAFTKRHFARRTALLAGAFYFTVPVVMLLATDLYVDLILAFFAFMAFYSFVLWYEEGRNSWLILTGIFSGLAAGTKYTGAIVFLILFVLMVLKSARAHKKKLDILKDTLIILLPFTVIFSPWLIKNYFFTGNPLFPFFFGGYGDGWGPANAVSYFQHIRGHGIAIKNLLDFLLVPWFLSTQGVRFGGGLDVWGPIILISVPWLVFARKFNRTIWLMLGFSLLYYSLWLLTGKVARFLIPIIQFLAIIAGFVFTEMINSRRHRKILNIIAGGVFIVILLHNWFMYVFCEAYIDPFKVSIGIETREQYLMRKVQYYPAMKYINEQLPETAGVLFLGEARGYYCRKRYIASSVFNKTPIVEWAENSGSADELMGILKKNHITHLFINEKEADRLQQEYKIFYWTDKGKKLFSGLIEKYGKQVFFHNNGLRVIELDFSQVK